MTTKSSPSVAVTGDPVLDRVWTQIAIVLALAGHAEVTGAR